MHSGPVPTNYNLASDLHQKLGPVLKAWLVRYVVITIIGKRIDQIGCVLAADKFVSPDEIIFALTCSRILEKLCARVTQDQGVLTAHPAASLLLFQRYRLQPNSSLTTKTGIKCFDLLKLNEFFSSEEGRRGGVAPFFPRL